jgi:dTMP kinase
MSNETEQALTQSRGQFIVVTGIDGSGKSTAIDYLQKRLDRTGDILVTREPGGTAMAEDLRAILLSHRTEQVDPLTELLLIFAARNQHYKRVIEPALRRGVTVLCSRWVESTRAYQCYGRGLDSSSVDVLEKMVCGDFQPDLTIVLDIEPEAGLKRARGRAELDRIENEDLYFFSKVRQGFLSLAGLEAASFKIVDATQSIDRVTDDVLGAVLSLRH